MFLFFVAVYRIRFHVILLLALLLVVSLLFAYFAPRTRRFLLMLIMRNAKHTLAEQAAVFFLIAKHLSALLLADTLGIMSIC